MGTPMGSVCSAWATLSDVCAPCDTYEMDTALIEDKLIVASEILYALTGSQWIGECVDTIRPCTTRGSVPLGAFQTWSGQSVSGTGSRWGVCGCTEDSGCGCSTLSVIRLPRRPVTGILAVIVDGITLDPSLYRVDDYERLVYLPGPGDERQGWPCFPAGTLVTTAGGQKPIETVAAGEMVLTHKGRWRRVARAGKTGDSETVRVVGRGGIVRSTPDHRFLAAPVHGIPGKRKLGASEWTEASALVGSAWAIPSVVESLPLRYPAGMTPEIAPANFWWFVGRWLGDGWTTGTESTGKRGGMGQGSVLICSSHAEADEVAAALALTGWQWRAHRQRTTVRWRLQDGPMRAWLRENFGTGAGSKTIPGWLLGAPRSVREELLAGFVSADGWTTDKFVSVHTVSRPLAVSLKMLVASLGYAPSYFEAPQHTTHIEGRRVSGKPTYRVDWPHAKPGDPFSQAWSEGGHVWGRVRSVALNPLVVPVYDLEVEDDHSFVADGMVVHNCCQYLDRAVGEVGTFQIAYLWGAPPPLGGVHSAASLACQLALASTGDARCQLPQRTSAVTRQGITIGFVDDFTTMLEKGGTGLRDVDLWIGSQRWRTANRPAAVYNPEHWNRATRTT